MHLRHEGDYSGVQYSTYCMSSFTPTVDLHPLCFKRNASLTMPYVPSQNVAGLRFSACIQRPNHGENCLASNQHSQHSKYTACNASSTATPYTFLCPSLTVWPPTHGNPQPLLGGRHPCHTQIFRRRSLTCRSVGSSSPDATRERRSL